MNEDFCCCFATHPYSKQIVTALVFCIENLRNQSWQLVGVGLNIVGTQLTIPIHQVVGDHVKGALLPVNAFLLQKCMAELLKY